MAVEYLGKSGWVYNSGTYTPPANANFFIFGLVGDASGGGGTPWTSVTWDGLTASAQSATSINYEEKVTTNGVLSALWYLVKPDCSGLGTLSYGGGVANNDDMVLLAFRGVNEKAPIYHELSEGGGPDNWSIDLNWLEGGQNVCVVSHNGTAEVPATDFTELTANALPRSAIGRRATDGLVGWNVTGGDRGAYCAAHLAPKPSGNQAIMIF